MRKASPATDRIAVGRCAEVAVSDYLFAQGFSLLGRNVRLGALELDIVARKGPLVVVVEVRTRRPGAIVGPFASVTPLKRARVLRAAQRLWRSRIARMRDVERLRIDVAAVAFVGRETRISYAAGAIVGVAFGKRLR